MNADRVVFLARLSLSTSFSSLSSMVIWMVFMWIAMWSRYHIIFHIPSGLK